MARKLLNLAGWLLGLALTVAVIRLALFVGSLLSDPP
jgi:hypothetical protein